MATKTKIKDSLKNVFINELKDKKEQERLERVKANANLKEITIYTNKEDKNSITYVDILKKEGINCIEKEISEHLEEWNHVAAKTNLAFFPTFHIQGEYLVFRRDFQNPQHLINILESFKNSAYSNSRRTLERMKTLNWHINTAFGRVDQLLRQIETKLNTEEDEHKSTD